MISQLSIRKSVNEISDKRQKLLPIRKQGTSLYPTNRTGSVHLFLKIRPYLSIQITHKIAKMTEFQRILLSLFPFQTQLYQCARRTSLNSLKSRSHPLCQIISPTRNMQPHHSRTGGQCTSVPLFKTHDTHIRRESFEGSLFF